MSQEQQQEEETTSRPFRKRLVIAKFPLVAVLITKSGEVPKDPHTQRQENSKHRAILRAISALVYFARKD